MSTLKKGRETIIENLQTHDSNKNQNQTKLKLSPYKILRISCLESAFNECVLYLWARSRRALTGLTGER